MTVIVLQLLRSPTEDPAEGKTCRNPFLAGQSGHLHCPYSGEHLALDPLKCSAGLWVCSPQAPDPAWPAASLASFTSWEHPLWNHLTQFQLKVSPGRASPPTTLRLPEPHPLSRKRPPSPLGVSFITCKMGITFNSRGSQ